MDSGSLASVGKVGDAGLHAEGELVLLDAGAGFGVADELVVLFVECAQAVEGVASDLGGDAGRVVDEQDGVAAAAEGDTGVLAREVAGGPEAGGDGLVLLVVRGAGDQDDEGGEVVVEGAQTVGDPGAEAGAAGDLVAGLHVGDGGLVVDGLGVHRADEAHVVDHFGRVGQ